jgi:hypothetical protein
MAGDVIGWLRCHVEYIFNIMEYSFTFVKANLMNNTPKCSAKTRAGTPCKRGTVPGKTRCKLHGGMPKVNETVFLHPASKTLIAADMAFNHDGNVDFATGLVLRLAGCHSGFNVSRFYKLFIGDRKSMRHSVDEVLDWDFERIVLGHGHIVQKDGRQILEDAYAFLRP